MRLRQDIGVYSAVYLTVCVDLHADGSMTWRPLPKEYIRGGDESVRFDGSRIAAVGWSE